MRCCDDSLGDRIDLVAPHARMRLPHDGWFVVIVSFLHGPPPTASIFRGAKASGMCWQRGNVTNVSLQCEYAMTSSFHDGSHSPRYPVYTSRPGIAKSPRSGRHYQRNLP